MDLRPRAAIRARELIHIEHIEHLGAFAVHRITILLQV